MRTIYFLLISCLLFLAGCVNQNPVTPNTETIQKSWITIPKVAELSIENSFFASAKINGNQGGELLLQGSYTGETNRFVSINSRLQVPQNAYSGIRTLTQAMGTAAYSDFGPSMIFNQPLILDFTISGIDLTGIDPNRINFYYMAPDGSFHVTQHEGILVDVQTGTLQVIKAKINHFSRYGWAK